GGIAGAAGVVQPDCVVDPCVDVMDDRVAADQEDLGVPLAADVVEAHERRAGVIVRELGGEQLHGTLSFFDWSRHFSSPCFWTLAPSAGRDPTLAQFTRSFGGHSHSALITSGRGWYMRRITNHSLSEGHGSQFASCSCPGDSACKWIVKP